MDYIVKKGIPSDEELEKVAVKIGIVWRSLGRRLGFNEEELDAFHKENEIYSEKPYKMLLRWKQRNYGHDATYQVLRVALCHELVGRKDLASKFCCDEVTGVQSGEHVSSPSGTASLPQYAGPRSDPPHKYQTEFVFGSHGKGQGQFDFPDDIAVSERTGNIAVADWNNNRIQIFNSERKYVKEFGAKGPGAEFLARPLSVAFTRSGDVIVVHDNKISVFPDAQFFKHVINEHLKSPLSVSVGRDGHLIVYDFGDKTIKVLSPYGTELLKSFSVPDCDVSPWFAVYHQDKFFVSYFSVHCVKVFNNEGVFLYNIGSPGPGDGQLNRPAGLAVDKFNNLIVCDSGNSRLQVFTLDGQFVSKTDQHTARLMSPYSVAVSQDGHVFVADVFTHSVHVMK